MPELKVARPARGSQIGFVTDLAVRKEYDMVEIPEEKSRQCLASPRNPRADRSSRHSQVNAADFNGQSRARKNAGCVLRQKHQRPFTDAVASDFRATSAPTIKVATPTDAAKFH